MKFDQTVCDRIITTTKPQGSDGIRVFNLSRRNCAYGAIEWRSKCENRFIR